MNIGRKILIKHYWEIKQFFLEKAPGISLKWYYYIFLYSAEKRYTDILKNYGNDVRIIICPYVGTGDIYLAAACLDEYLKQNSINNYVFVVIGNSNVNVSKLFGIKNVLKLSQLEMDRFVQFLSFKGIDGESVIIAHPDPPNLYTGIMDMMRNYHELNFADMFTYGVFKINNQKLARPVFANKSILVKDVIKKCNLIRGKTVLLAPYSYTLAGIPDWVWRKLVKELKGKGYSVCTNCGSDAEKEIDGSYRICLPYSDMQVFLEYAGNFIGIRSGFCDIVSSIACKKIIIYQPYLFWGPSGNIDYFSLRGMGLDTSAIEIQYEGIEFLKLINDITKQLD